MLVQSGSASGLSATDRFPRELCVGGFFVPRKAHQMPATATRLLTATEAQIRSGRSMVRFRQWVAAGRLPFTVDEFGRRRFDVEDVDRLVADVDRYKLEDATAVADAS